MRSLLLAARLLSAIFRPQYFPVLGFVTLFLFTYMSMLPWQFKGAVLALVLLGTVLLPRWTIYFWRRASGLELHLLRHRQNRYFPYLIGICYYVFTLHILSRFHLPTFMSGIIVSAIMIQVACAFINLFWKISTHCAGAGGVCGALVAFSLLFSFNPLWWLCLCILLTGLVATSRMLLRQHSLGQVTAGAILGSVCGFAGIIMPL